MSQFPSPCFRLLTELGSLPRSRTKYFVQGHIESLGHTREMMAVSDHRPTSWPLSFTTLFTIQPHGKAFPCNCTGQARQWKEWVSLEKGRGSCKIFLVPAQLTPLSFSHTISFIPHLTLPSLFIFAQYFTTFLHTELLAVLSKRSRCTTMLAVTQGSSCTPGSSAVFRVAFQQQHGEFPRSKAAHEASDRSWGHLAQSCA